LSIHPDILKRSLACDVEWRVLHAGDARSILQDFTHTLKCERERLLSSVLRYQPRLAVRISSEASAQLNSFIDSFLFMTEAMRLTIY
jgi:hypothetical protein